MLKPLVSGLGAVTSIANAGDSRLFLTLRTGKIVVWEGNHLSPKPFLNISRLVGDRGLLSAAFDPDYKFNGLFFVAYADKAGNLAIARYKRSAQKPDHADRKSGVVLLRIPHPPDADHFGGDLQFGPDGYLYVGVGDGGSTKGSTGSAQRDDVLLGKILRLDVEANATRPPFYGTPASNPFAGGGPALKEIWAKGLRDPWRFSFDRETGDLYIADVGQSARQEIDFQAHGSRGGENYGWDIMEGSLCRVPDAPGCAARPTQNPLTSLRLPMLEYGNRFGDCAVVGGYVYRGGADPRLAGVYFYGDYCTGHIWGGDQLTNAVAPKLTTFGEDSKGELYAATETGTLYRILSPLPVLQPPWRAETVPEPAIAPNTSPLIEPVFLPEFQPRPPITPTAPSPVFVEVPVPIYVPEPVQPIQEPPPPAPPPEPPPAPPATPAPQPTPAPPATPDRQNPTVVPRELPPPRTVSPRG